MGVAFGEGVRAEADPGAGAVVLEGSTGRPYIDKTYVVDLSSEVAGGTWKLQVKDMLGTITMPAAITSWTLNLTGAVSNCMGTNGTDVAIPNRSAAESPITISDCSSNASSASAVEMHIVHPHPGYLTVTLVAPDGSAYVLRDHVYDGRDINTVSYVDLSSETRNGIWTLRVSDDYRGIEAKYIESWTLSLGDQP